MERVQSTKRWQLSESFLLAALLAFVGGFLDVYTYIIRGKVFCNAQTGNIVLMGMHLAQGEFSRSLDYLFPILSCIAGVFFADYARKKWGNGRHIHWRQIIVAIEMIVVIIASFIPGGDINVLVNTMISFVCALQMETFRKFHGIAIASTMCTGNLRSGTHALFEGVLGHETDNVNKALSYYKVIIFFLVGVSAGAILTNIFLDKSILFAAGVLGLALVLMCREHI